MEYVIGIALLLIMVIGGLWQRAIEKKLWNHGVNAENNMKWRYFDTDSQGGRGYKDDQGNRIWISYNIDN